MILIKLVFNTILLTWRIKNLINRTRADKFLRHKAYDIASNPTINQLLENLIKEKCIHLLKTIFGVLI